MVSQYSVIIGLGNGVWPVCRQAITWTSDDLLPLVPMEANFDRGWGTWYVNPTGLCRPQGSLLELNFRSQGSILGQISVSEGLILAEAPLPIVY